MSLLQSIPPTTADKQTQAQKRRGSRSRKLLGAKAKSYRLKSICIPYTILPDTCIYKHLFNLQSISAFDFRREWTIIITVLTYHIFILSACHTTIKHLLNFIHQQQLPHHQKACRNYFPRLIRCFVFKTIFGIMPGILQALNLQGHKCITASQI